MKLLAASREVSPDCHIQDTVLRILYHGERLGRNMLVIPGLTRDPVPLRETYPR